MYRGELADSEQGRTIAALCAARPPMVSVSIRGEFAGEMFEEDTPAGVVTTAERLVLHGLDFTGQPGVKATSASTVEGRSRTSAREVRESVTIAPAGRPDGVPSPLTLADQVLAGVAGAAADSEAAWMAQAQRARAGSVALTAAQQDRHDVLAALGQWVRGR
jgi:hypothetical protein